MQIVAVARAAQDSMLCSIGLYVVQHMTLCCTAQDSMLCSLQLHVHPYTDACGQARKDQDMQIQSSSYLNRCIYTSVHEQAIMYMYLAQSHIRMIVWQPARENVWYSCTLETWNCPWEGLNSL